MSLLFLLCCASDLIDSGDTAVEVDRVFLDADRDGFGRPDAPVPWYEATAMHVGNDRDCDDSDPDIWPGVSEVANGLDDDCDGLVDESDVTWFIDGDGDGFGNPDFPRSVLEAPKGTVANDWDCDDLQARVHPGAPELCDHRDNDCDGVVDGPSCR